MGCVTMRDKDLCMSGTRWESQAFMNHEHGMGFHYVHGARALVRNECTQA